ncbi:nucleoside hydrolase [Streptomyces sp. NPDC059477]|uniref:nucleoside hydrolase n=1 Tax=Streptomyces sp. NPDC059477 TaxID=3346847 RepID=UPI0036A115A4
MISSVHDGGSPRARKILIDSDTAVDDAPGILSCLVDPDVEVVGITTLAGNVALRHTTANALRALDLTGVQVPVVPGAERTLSGTATVHVPHVHGPEGHGNLEVGPPKARAAEGEAAWDFIGRQIAEHRGELTIVSSGPLTNLALAVLAHRAAFDRYRPRVVWMGGAIEHSGNVSPVAEFNAAADPEAAAVVLSAGLDLTVLPLDVTERAPHLPGAIVLTEADTDRLLREGNPLGVYIGAISGAYIDFYEGVFGARACPLHSALAMRIAADPTLVVQEDWMPLAVETAGRLTRGMTVADRTHLRLPPRQQSIPPGSARIVREVDGRRFLGDLDRVLTDPSLGVAI